MISGLVGVVILVSVWASGYVLGLVSGYVLGRRQKIFGVNDDVIRDALKD